MTFVPKGHERERSLVTDESLLIVLEELLVEGKDQLIGQNDAQMNEKNHWFTETCSLLTRSLSSPREIMR